MTIKQFFLFVICFGVMQAMAKDKFDVRNAKIDLFETKANGEVIISGCWVGTMNYNGRTRQCFKAKVSDKDLIQILEKSSSFQSFSDLLSGKLSIEEYSKKPLEECFSLITKEPKGSDVDDLTIRELAKVKVHKCYKPGRYTVIKTNRDAITDTERGNIKPIIIKNEERPFRGNTGSRSIEY